MYRELKRYQHPKIVDHLASNYVLGTLPDLVAKRVDSIRANEVNQALNDRILFWETTMSPLNDDIQEIEPLSATFANISHELGFSESAEQPEAWWKSWFRSPVHWVSVASVFMVALLSINTLQTDDSLGPLSYVAVLANTDQQPQLVAATYGDTRTLLLDIVELPVLAKEESFELWVKSKTDNQIRSLGEIPKGQNSFERELTVAEWRLIKDSDSLLVSIEEIGGSPIGEPLGQVISQGACVRLSAWQSPGQA